MAGERELDKIWERNEYEERVRADCRAISICQCTDDSEKMDEETRGGLVSKKLVRIELHEVFCRRVSNTKELGITNLFIMVMLTLKRNFYRTSIISSDLQDRLYCHHRSRMKEKKERKFTKCYCLARQRCQEHYV